MQEPRLRTVEKYKPPYPLNQFPANFAINLGREVVYLLATRETSRIEGSDWEEIFARLIGGRWKPSNIGLDDVLLEQTVWSAKTVKHDNPARTRRIRLISGRNSPVYSFGDQKVTDVDPNDLGAKVLAIWNERVAGVKQNYRHMRTVVLIKAEDLLELAVYEFNTAIYPEENYAWRWNRRGNLEGSARDTGEHRFTWQPHGSQFTIIEDVPRDRLAIRIKQPPTLNRDQVLDVLHFDPSWVEIIK